jgi:DNA-binding CsgD family transcriptional regulator
MGTILEFIGFTYFMTLLIKTKIQQSDNLQLELQKRSKELIESSKKLEELNQLLKAKTSIERTDLLNIFSLLESSLSREGDWKIFKQKFEELNPAFLKHLMDKQSDLSKSEIRLLTLIRIGYSQKEIASMLNIAPDSVKKARNRVRKKMNLSEHVEAVQQSVSFVHSHSFRVSNSHYPQNLCPRPRLRPSFLDIRTN